jgi:GntR family transcriptional regulator/MocR family aminotransferase
MKSDRIIFLQTFNRTMFPGLRIAFLVIPPALVEAFSAARDTMDGSTNVPNQLVLAEFLELGHYGSHLRFSKQVHDRRRAALILQLKENLPPGFLVNEDRNGLHLVVSCPPGVDDRLLAEHVRRNHLACVAVRDFAAAESSQQGLILGFAAFEEEEMAVATAQLGQSIRSY